DTLLVTIFGFFVFYLFGWYMGRGLDREGRIATTFSSGVNNNALGIGIAAIHFEPRVALFLVVSEFPWIAAIALFGKFLRKRSEECH
ncbi:MAG: hypothetical protein KDD60_13080, partial [Bdellovibrionales bacterium]|nr:hypothetical protein [Bdellovibrionales bacterium]